MVMTYRDTKGSPLTFAEVDANFRDVFGRVTNVNLAGLSAVTSAANTLPYFNSITGGMDVTGFTPFARSLLAEATLLAAQQRLGAQLSQTDATTGALLTVGAFGLGAKTAVLVANDLNVAMPNGYYTYSAATANRPDVGGAAGNGIVLHFEQSTGTMCFQLCFELDGRVYRRTRDGNTAIGVWGAWDYLAQGTEIATKQDKHVNLTALSAITGAANKLSYFTSSSAMATIDFTAYSQGLIGLADAATWKGATGLDLKIGLANGLATLGADGKIPTSQLPPLAVNEVFTVASQAAMLALAAERGDVAIRTDQAGKAYILSVDAPTVLANWIGLDQALSAALGALNALTPAADKVPYFTGTATASLLTASTLGKALLAIADDVAARSAIVAAKSGANSDITSLAGLTTALSILQGGTGVTTTAALLTALIAAGAYAKSNAVGTVSQSGGIPTGAIVEKGSNANGSYTKYLDGTMICWGSTPGLDQTTTSQAYSLGVTLPATFIDTNFKVSVNIISVNVTNVFEGYGRAGSGTTSTFALVQYWNFVQTYAYTFIAIGRWF